MCLLYIIYYIRIIYVICIIYNGEGNGNPLQCSCLENLMDRDWRAAVCGVTQSGHD